MLLLTLTSPLCGKQSIPFVKKLQLLSSRGSLVWNEELWLGSDFFITLTSSFTMKQSHYFKCFPLVKLPPLLLWCACFWTCPSCKKPNSSCKFKHILWSPPTFPFTSPKKIKTEEQQNLFYPARRCVPHCRSRQSSARGSRAFPAVFRQKQGSTIPLS